MNFKTDLSIENQKLLQDIDYQIKNKEYSSEEIKQCESYIADYIMSFSSKNNDISKEIKKYDELIDILVRNEN